MNDDLSLGSTTMEKFFYNSDFAIQENLSEGLIKYIQYEKQIINEELQRRLQGQAEEENKFNYSVNDQTVEEIVKQRIKKQIVFEKNSQQCLVLLLKQKEQNKQQAQSVQEISQLLIEYKLETICFMKIKDDNLNLSFFDTNEQYQATNNTDKRTMTNNLSLSGDHSKLIEIQYWGSQQNKPVQKLIQSSKAIQGLLQAINQNSSYQPLQRNITFIIVCSIDLETLEMLDNLGGLISNQEKQVQSLDASKSCTQPLQSQEKEQKEQQIIYQTLKVQNDKAPRVSRKLDLLNDAQSVDDKTQKMSIDKDAGTEQSTDISSHIGSQNFDKQSLFDQKGKDLDDEEYKEIHHYQQHDDFPRPLPPILSDKLPETRKDLSIENQLKEQCIDPILSEMNDKNNKFGTLVYDQPQTNSSDQKKDEKSLIAQLLQSLFIGNQNQGKTNQKLLIISPTASLADILINELTQNNIAQVIVTNKSKQSQAPDSQLPKIANFFGKSIKYISNRSVYEDLVKQFSLAFISSKLLYEYLMRQIIKIDDFELIIFHDLSQFSDKLHQWIAEDYYLDCQFENRPKLLSFFSQKPKAPQTWLDWLKKTQTSFTSKLLNLPPQVTELIQNQEMKQLIQSSQKSKEMKDFNDKFTVPLRPKRRPSEWLRYKDYLQKKQDDDGKILRATASFTIRDSYNILREILERLGLLCKHDKCKEPLSGKPHSFERIENSRSLDDKRKQNIMVAETTNFLGKGLKGHKPVRMILPHCVKRFLDDIDFTQLGNVEIFDLKSDCEGYMCFEVIKQVVRMGIVDEHSHLIKEVAEDYIKYGKLSQPVKQQHEQLIQEDYQKKTFTHIKNWYILDKISLQKSIFIFVAVNEHQTSTLFKKSLSNKEETKDFIYSGVDNQQAIGFIFPDDRFRNRVMNYETQIDTHQRFQHIEYLLMTQKARDKNEAFEMTSHHQDIIPYSLNKVIIEVKIDRNLENLQAIKCFHVWSMYSVANLESSFFKHLFKGKFSFSKVFFSKEIERLSKKQFFTSKFQPKLKEKNKTDKYKKDYQYVVPIRIRKNTKIGSHSYEVNFDLIEQLIRHIKMQIVSFASGGLHPSYSHSPYIESEPNQSPQSCIWSQIGAKGGCRQVVDVITGVNQEEKWNQMSINLQTKSEVTNKWNRMSLTQFFMAQQNVLINQKETKNLYKVKKLDTFVDNSATKSAYSMQDGKVQKVIDNVLLASDNKIEQSLEILNSKVQTQIVSAQMLESYPLNYEMFTLIQGSFTHFLKINDFLRTEAFIENQFKNYQDFQPINQFPMLSFDPFYKAQEKLSVKETLLQNISIVNQALTAPQTQMTVNNERLKTYGDALIQLMYSVNIYLNRSEQDTEKDLDSLRKQLNTKQSLDQINIRNKIYEYMQVESQSQQPITINLDKDSTQKIVESVCNRTYTIHKSVIPGSLGDQKFLQLLKNSSKHNQEHNASLTNAKIQSLRDKSNKREPRALFTATEFEQICDILTLILCRPIWAAAFKEKLSEMYNSIEIARKQEGNLIKNYATLLITKYDLRIQDLQAFILEVNLQRSTKIQKKYFKMDNEETKLSTDLGFSQSQPVESDESPLSKKNLDNQSVMVNQINNDSKLGEAVEALLATVSLTCGVQECYHFMNNLGVFQNNIEQLQAKVEREIKPKEAEYGDRSWIEEVEKIINYKFNNKDLAQKAFQHQTYCAYMEKESKVKLENYNLLEFIGDSVMNFLVTDFYFKHSERSDLRKIYGHDQIHKLKTELTNNNFIAIVMIELGLHEFIKIKERTATFNISFANFVQSIQKSIFDQSGETLPTKQIYTEYFIKKTWLKDPEINQKYPKECEIYSNKNLEEIFMDPSCMKFLANITENLKFPQSESEVFHLKIFADVLEALLGAVFIDSGCDLNMTKKVFMNFFKPYLYVFGNMETVQDHPKTKLIQYWNKFPFGKINGYPVEIKHISVFEEGFNEKNCQTKTYLYQGILGGIEVINERYEFQVKNKVKQFYRFFHWFIKELVSELQSRYPLFQKDLEILSKLQKLKADHPDQAALKMKLNYAQSLQDLHIEVLKTIREFKVGWNRIDLSKLKKEYVRQGSQEMLMGTIQGPFGEHQKVVYKIEESKTQQKHLKKEYETLQEIGIHQNIIVCKRYGKKLCKQFDDQKCAYLALEYIEDKPSLLQFILFKKDDSEIWVRYLFKQLLSAVIQISKAGYAHLDLSIDNILLDDSLNIKLTGFGNAQNKNKVNLPKNMILKYYQAPEICQGKTIIDGEKADVFALAVILFIMLTKREPTEKVFDVTCSKRYQLFCEGQWSSFWPKSIQSSDDFKNLFKWMYQPIPAERPTLKQIQEHPWVKNGPVPDEKEIMDELQRFDQIKKGLFNQWFIQQSFKFNFTMEYNKMKSGFSDDRLDVTNLQEYIAEKCKNLKEYRPEYYQWTSIKLQDCVQPHFILALLIEITNSVILDEEIKFQAKIHQKQTHLEAKIYQIEIQEDKYSAYQLHTPAITPKSSVLENQYRCKDITQDGVRCSREVKQDPSGLCHDHKVFGKIQIYSEKGSIRAIFKRDKGDNFIFQKLFSEVVSHQQIQDKLIQGYEDQ